VFARLIDTAGLRKKGKVGYSIERFALVRAVRSVERCDVALVVLDASEGITEQDVKIAGIVKEYGKGTIFLLNKWDLIVGPEEVYKKIVPELVRKMWFSPYAPCITISGLGRKRITKVFPVVDRIIGERRKRIATGELNRFFRDFVGKMVLPAYRGRNVKLFYMTQVREEPPGFVIFSNYPEAVKEQHLRFIEKGLRDSFSFEGTPLRIYVRARKKDRAP
jgi:GTP-binding protein